MISRIVRLLAVFLVIGIVLYIVMLNKAETTVFFSGDRFITKNTGVILIGAFLFGVISSSIFALYFELKGRLRERALANKERQRASFLDGVIKARSYQASGEYNKALSLWEQLIKSDPTNIIARLELSKCLESTNENREALKVLDTARAQSPGNIELLFRASELNLLLGNRTAAVDNLALALHHQPSALAAAKARDLSEALGRIEDALEYQTRLEALGSTTDDLDQIRSRLEYKKILHNFGDNPVGLLAELKTFVRHRDNVEALRKLAELEAGSGNLDQAAAQLIRAAKISHSPAIWYEATRLWIEHRQPDRAISAARAATKETSGEDRLRAELNLIRIFLGLGMFDDAKKAIDQFSNLTSSGPAQPSRRIIEDFLILKGLSLNQSGQYHESAQVWLKLTNYELDPGQAQVDPVLTVNGNSPSASPSPVLSTP